MRGFTLIELTLVTALIVVIAGFMFPVGNTYLKRHTLADTSHDITNAARSAWMSASFQEADSAHGVRVLPDSFVVFAGTSYKTRDASRDESFALPEGMTRSGLEEVVFAKVSGTPSATGTISLTFGGGTRDIHILEHGRVQN